MNKRLILNINSKVIENAKRNLQTKEQSLSGLIEDYFKVLIFTKTEKSTSSPVVKELLGIAKIDKKANKKKLSLNIYWRSINENFSS